MYRARQHHPDRWVAISIFDVRLTERAAVEQFRAEARAIGKLAHPGVLPVHGADVLPDARPYLVTELCEGSLADRIAARERFETLVEEQMHQPVEIADLAVRGDDLIAAGVSEGPAIGAALRKLLAAVVDDPSKNERDTLLRLASASEPID